MNYQPVSFYRDQGWSVERLADYYNPAGVAEKVTVFAYQEPEPFDLSASTRVVGYHSQDDLTRFVVDFGPDVIRCYEANYPFCIMALQLAKKINVPSYLSLHDSRKQHVKQLSAYTVITAYTETVRNIAKSRLGRDIELQLNGIDSAFFDPALVTDDDIQFTGFNAGIGDAECVIYTIGRNDPLLNIPVQVEAVNQFRERTGVHAVFVISGPGFEKADFKNEGHGFVIPVGKTTQKDIRTFHMISDFFMQVRIVPEIPMAATEALMMGSPVIHAYGIETKKKIQWPIGLTVNKVDDPEVIADYIEFMWVNLAEARAARKERRDSVVAEYDSNMLRKREADRYKRLYAKESDWKTKHSGRQTPF